MIKVKDLQSFNSQPLVTVGVLAYNRSKGLQRTLRCMMAQSYTNLEIIVSDNCSSDPAVKKVALEAADADLRIKYVRQDCNIGVFNNSWALLCMSKGDYFMFAADDDFWDENYIECLLAKIVSNPQCVLAISELKVAFAESSEVAYSAPEIIPCDFQKYEINDLMSRITVHVKDPASVSAHLIYGLTRHSSMYSAFQRVRELYSHPVNMDVHIVFHLLLQGPVAIELSTYRLWIIHEKTTGLLYCAENKLKNTGWKFADLSKRLKVQSDLVEKFPMRESERIVLMALLRRKLNFLPISYAIQSIRSYGVNVMQFFRIHGAYLKLKRSIGLV